MEHGAAMRNPGKAQKEAKIGVFGRYIFHKMQAAQGLEPFQFANCVYWLFSE
jgi:hypothetical protein